MFPFINNALKLHLHLSNFLFPLSFFLQTPGTVPPNAEMEPKAPNGKDKGNKKSKGNSGNANVNGVRTGESGKAASSSGNDGATQRFLNINFYFTKSVCISLIMVHYIILYAMLIVNFEHKQCRKWK